VAGAQEHPPVDGVVEARACAVVAVAAGDGAARLFANLGVTAVVAGGQSMNPSTQEILDAVVASAGDSVVVLPNNKNIVAVAEQAAALADRPVRVIPTRSMVEGLAAMIEFDADSDAEGNAATMGAEAGRVRAAEVTRAVRASTADCGPIAVGDWISPDMTRRVTLAEGAESYFDSLGPGELVELDTSPLAVRAFRRPSPNEERPYRAGATLLQAASLSRPGLRRFNRWT
jgi:dihydroxyacetone kinase-like predicted kinase